MVDELWLKNKHAIGQAFFLVASDVGGYWLEIVIPIIIFYIRFYSVIHSLVQWTKNGERNSDCLFFSLFFLSPRYSVSLCLCVSRFYLTKDLCKRNSEEQTFSLVNTSDL